MTRKVNWFLRLVPIVAIPIAAIGCEEDRERVLDIEAPGVDIQVDRVDEPGE